MVTSLPNASSEAACFAAAEVLAGLRGVDAREPDLNLCLVGLKDGQSVAIGDADHAGRVVGGKGRSGRQDQDEGGDKAFHGGRIGFAAGKFNRGCNNPTRAAKIVSPNFRLALRVPGVSDEANQSPCPCCSRASLIILAPMASQAFKSIIDDERERVDNFYRNHTNNAVLPKELKPSGFEGYHWACFGIGVSLVFAGIRESKQACSVKPEGWEMAEV